MMFLVLCCLARVVDGGAGCGVVFVSLSAFHWLSLMGSSLMFWLACFPVLSSFFFVVVFFVSVLSLPVFYYIVFVVRVLLFVLLCFALVLCLLWSLSLFACLLVVYDCSCFLFRKFCSCILCASLLFSFDSSLWSWFCLFAALSPFAVARVQMSCTHFAYARNCFLFCPPFRGVVFGSCLFPLLVASSLVFVSCPDTLPLYASPSISFPVSRPWQCRQVTTSIPQRSSPSPPPPPGIHRLRCSRRC